jgi:3-oxoacyl-[acyl-carrier-protein] synthase II
MSQLADMLRQQPLAVTGLGVWSAAGTGPDELWRAARAGQSTGRFGVVPGRPELAVCPAPTPELPPAARRVLRRMDRAVHLGWAAATQALAEAGLPAGTDRGRLGLVVGNSRGLVDTWTQAARPMTPRHELPSLAANGSITALSGALSLLLGLRGPCQVTSAACASGAVAIALAAQQLLLGQADFMLAGGAEAPLHPAVLDPLMAAGVLGWHGDPAQTCRPFDQARNGTILGEGAAFIALETLASARRRGARVQALLGGWHWASEAAHRAGFETGHSGLALTLREALRVAGLEPAQIGSLNTHGTGTRLNDEREALAIAEVFGPRPLLQYTSTKPVTGHCLGASSAIEAILSIQALREQATPPTVNCRAPDAGCPPGLVTGQARAFSAEAVLSSSSGIWGNQAALLFRRPPSNEQTQHGKSGT